MASAARHPNVECTFITQGAEDHGSSLYYVTPDYILRCSGNNKPVGGEERESTTFIRRRKITYRRNTEGMATFERPEEGYYPHEEDDRGRYHDGDKIARIISGDPNRSRMPPEWHETNGVSWGTAVDEINAARELVRAHPSVSRAKRKVSEKDFTIEDRLPPSLPGFSR